MSDAILTTIRTQLTNAADEKTKAGTQRYFKEAVIAYGVKTPLVSKIASENYSLIKNKPKSTVFSLCEELLQSGFLEESWIAAGWSHRLAKRFEPEDFTVFEHWVGKYISNWATCDTFCNHTMGTYIEMYPECIGKIKGWTASPNRWVKRASAVSFIIPARKGMFLKDIFEIADTLLTDSDDMVQKGYGWLLKEASRKHQKEVFDFVVARKDRMPRTALRYAIEKMPDNLRKPAMAKEK